MNMCLKMLFTLSLSGTALILVLLGAKRIFAVSYTHLTLPTTERV